MNAIFVPELRTGLLVVILNESVGEIIKVRLRCNLAIGLFLVIGPGVVVVIYIQGAHQDVNLMRWVSRTGATAYQYI